MLSKVNQFWRFRTQDELDEFLNMAQDSADEYKLTNYGLSQKGDYYAFGDIVVHTKFGKKAAQAQQQNAQNNQQNSNVQAELNLA